MNERIVILRKELGLSMDKFGKEIGITRSAINKIEKGANNLTEQTALSICRTFRVNYFWLVDGKGDMFTETPESVIDEIAEDYNLDDLDKKIIEKYLELTFEQRKVIKEYFKSIFL